MPTAPVPPSTSTIGSANTRTTAVIATPMTAASHSPCTAWWAAARSRPAPSSRDTAAVVP